MCVRMCYQRGRTVRTDGQGVRQGRWVGKGRVVHRLRLSLDCVEVDWRRQWARDYGVISLQTKISEHLHDRWCLCLNGGHWTSAVQVLCDHVSTRSRHRVAAQSHQHRAINTELKDRFLCLVEERRGRPTAWHAVRRNLPGLYPVLSCAPSGSAQAVQSDGAPLDGATP